MKPGLFSRPDDSSVVCEKFVNHARGTDTVREAPSMNAAFTKDLLWTDARSAHVVQKNDRTL